MPPQYSDDDTDKSSADEDPYARGEGYVRKARFRLLSPTEYDPAEVQRFVSELKQEDLLANKHYIQLLQAYTNQQLAGPRAAAPSSTASSATAAAPQAAPDDRDDWDYSNSFFHVNFRLHPAAAAARPPELPATLPWTQDEWKASKKSNASEEKENETPVQAQSGSSRLGQFESRFNSKGARPDDAATAELERVERELRARLLQVLPRSPEARQRLSYMKSITKGHHDLLDRLRSIVVGEFDSKTNPLAKEFADAPAHWRVDKVIGRVAEALRRELGVVTTKVKKTQATAAGATGKRKEKSAKVRFFQIP